ncbi:MAG: lytic transglycosylase domain-containing protein [Pseudomonadales bacterium]|nr:lytic transglycosylase domain-containing protein [Pseudomonadales bacterium]
MNNIIIRCLLSSVLLSAHIVNADIYRYTDENGKLHYGDKRLNKKYVPIEYSWKGWVEVTYFKSYAKNKKLFHPYIADAASRHGINAKLIHAVIYAESYYNPKIKSHAGAVGLMQLMPATAKRFGVTNRRNPEQNIEGGVKYLKVLMKMFNNDLKLVLAAYNAGEGTVRKYGNKIPPYPETQNYVKKVLKLYRG